MTTQSRTLSTFSRVLKQLRAERQYLDTMIEQTMKLIDMAEIEPGKLNRAEPSAKPTVRPGSNREKLYEFLKKQSEPMTGPQIATAMRKSGLRFKPHAVASGLQHGRKIGLLRSTETGFVWAEKQS